MFIGRSAHKLIFEISIVSVLLGFIMWIAYVRTETITTLLTGCSLVVVYFFYSLNVMRPCSIEISEQRFLIAYSNLLGKKKIAEYNIQSVRARLSYVATGRFRKAYKLVLSDLYGKPIVSLYSGSDGFSKAELRSFYESIPRPIG